MEYFKNLQKHANATGMVVYPTELDVILELLEVIPMQLGFQIDCGTFIIDGQLYGEDAECIARGTFRHGFYLHPVPRSRENSDTIAEESIDQVLAWPKHSSCYMDEFCRNPIGLVVDGRQEIYPASGIYQDGELLVLVLNATEGRFLASIKAGHSGVIFDEESCGLLFSLSEAFYALRQHDAVLQRSSTDINMDMAKHGDYMDYIHYTLEYLHRAESPAIKAWREWYRRSSPFEHEPRPIDAWSNTFF